jgi:hypothetical protein
MAISMLKHVSGMAFDAEGNFYAAERKTKSIGGGLLMLAHDVDDICRQEHLCYYA